MKYLTASQWAKVQGISARRVRALCEQGRIPNATKVGPYWIIPASAKPTTPKGRWG